MDRLQQQLNWALLSSRKAEYSAEASDGDPSRRNTPRSFCSWGGLGVCGQISSASAPGRKDLSIKLAQTEELLGRSLEERLRLDL